MRRFQQLLLCMFMSIAGAAHAADIAALKFDPTNATAGMPVNIIIEFTDTTRCGMVLNFGDGTNQEIKIESSKIEKVSHVYQASGAYAVSAQGRFLLRGLKTYLPCGGPNQAAAIVVGAGSTAVADEARPPAMAQAISTPLSAVAQSPAPEPPPLNPAVAAPSVPVLPITSRENSDVSVTVQRGHGGNVTAVTFSPNGATLATGSEDKTLKLWDVATGRELRTLTGHEGKISAVTFSPDGRFLLSGDDSFASGNIKIWDVETGRIVKTLGAGGPVSSAHYLPGGATAIVAGVHGVQFWDVASAERVRELKSQKSGNELVVAMALDGKIGVLAACGVDNVIQIWDLNKGSQLRTLQGQNSRITALALSPNGKLLASLHTGQKIVIWDLTTGAALRTVAGQMAYYSLAFSEDSRTLLSTSMDTRIRVIDVNSGKELKAFGPAYTAFPAPPILRFAIDPARKLMALADVSDGLRLWDLSLSKEGATIIGENHEIESVAYGRNGQFIVSGGHDSTIQLWDARTGQSLRAMEEGFGAVTAIATSPDGKTIVSAGAGMAVKLWDKDTGAAQRELEGDTDNGISLAVSGDGKLLASGKFNKNIELWNVASGKVLRTMNGHTETVNTVAFNPKATLLASGSMDKSVRVWDVASGRQLRMLSSHDAQIGSVAFSPDGAKLAAGDWRNSITVWDANSEKVLVTLDGHDAPVNSIAFSGDGRSLVSASSDKTIKIWDLATNLPRRTLKGHESKVTALALSPDGKNIVSSSNDRTIRVWDFASGRQLLMIAPLGSHDWIAITPEGYFQSSSELAESSLLVRYGPNLRDVTDMRSFRERFYRPDIVQVALTGKSLGNVPTLAGTKPAPMISLTDIPPTVNSDSISLPINLVERGGGIGDVRVYVNGTAVASGGGRNLTIVASGKRIAIPLRLVPGKNEVRVVAFNADNSMSSDPVTATITANYQSNRKPQLHALVVGVDKFENPKLTLKYSVADATAISDILTRKAAGMFEKVEVQLLVTPQQTSRQSLLDAFSKYKGLHADDVFVFYVASHGTVDGESLATQEYYLIPSNVGSTSAASLKRDAISQQEIKTLLSSVPASKKLVLLDTCQSGALGEALQTTMGTRGVSEDAAIKVLSNAVGSSIISASTAQQFALEGLQGHGVFTAVLLQGLAGKADTLKKGFVNTLDLASYVDTEVPRVAEEIFKRKQFPTLHNAGQAFPIVLSQ